MSASDKTGVCLPPELESLVQKHTHNHLLNPISGNIRPIDISSAFRSGSSRNDDPKVVEQYRQGIAIDVLREKSELFPYRLDVLQEAEREVLRQWYSVKRGPKLVQFHHTSVPKLEGVWTPQVSRRTDLKATPLALEVSQRLSAVPFRVKGDLNDLFWQVRKMIPLGKTDNTRFSGQESFYPMRLRSMSLATGGEEFYLVMGVLCRALRQYAKCAGTMHPMFDPASRAMVQGASMVPINRRNWRHFVSWCKRHFAKNETLKDWCSRCLSDPKQALLAGALGEPGGCGQYEFAACKEYARLDRLPGSDRVSSFLAELDTVGSGPMFLKLIYWICVQLNEIDVTAAGHTHPREELRAQILLEQLPFLSVLPKAVLMKLLKLIFSPKTYGAGAGPVYDCLTGTTGMREGFSSWDDLSMPSALRNQLVHLPVSLGHSELKRTAGLLSKAFDNCFPHLKKANEWALKEWRETPWQERSIGGDLMMSPFRFDGIEDEDVNTTENPEHNVASGWRVRTTYTHPILKKDKGVSTSVDPGSADETGTAMLAGRLHRKDAVHRGETVLLFSERAKYSGDMVSIHDAGMMYIGEMDDYMKADSQALINLYPEICKKIGFTTRSRICN